MKNMICITIITLKKFSVNNKNNLNNLKETDVWSFILFALFKMREIPEYTSLSELIYILDALSKRENTDKALEQYAEMGKKSLEEPQNNKAAFIDILLLGLVTASFSLLLLVGLF